MSKMSFEMVLVRHGETEANKRKMTQGHMDTPLNEVGLNQADLVAKSLASQHFDMAISSDLKRANQTAEAIRRENISLKSGSEVEKWPIARERCFGELQGKHHKEKMAAIEHMDEVSLLDWGPKNGETGHEFRERAKLFLKQLCGRAAKLEAISGTPVVLVVSHGGFIRELVLHLVSDLNCEMPCELGEYDGVSVNTGVSRYMFELNDDASVAGVVCSLLYSKEHLAGLDFIIPPENIAKTPVKKRWNQKKLTLEERKAKVAKKKEAILSQINEMKEQQQTTTSE